MRLNEALASVSERFGTPMVLGSSAPCPEGTVHAVALDGEPAEVTLPVVVESASGDCRVVDGPSPEWLSLVARFPDD